MERPLVSIDLLMFKEEKEALKKAIESVINQTYRPIELNVLDNNPGEKGRGTLLKELKEILKGATPPLFFQYSASQRNTGFAGGHNILIRQSKGAYICMLNSDAWLDNHFVANALEIFAEDEKIGAVQSKMFRYDFKKDRVVTKDDKALIDATGLLMLKNRRVIARGQGEKDEGQYDYPPSHKATADFRFSNDSASPHQENLKEIFGADGAAPVYLREALEDVKLSKHSTLNAERSFEYLDESFFAYKEDVDLAWRLRLYGWKTIYSPNLVSFHARGSGESAARSYLAIIKERRAIKSLAKELSWRNQRLMQVKNELCLLFLLHFPRIFLKEIASFFYILFFERYALRSMRDFFRLLPQAIAKRRIIMAHKRVGCKEMARWFE